jgi:diguanylate cyclase (GGDEF)-like protein
MSPPRERSGPAARVLVVDDNLFSLRITTTTLRHAGFEVTEATNGADALALFERFRHDAVLLDLVMPGLDGFEVCRRLRALPRGAGVPILMFTGRDDTGSIERAYETGATDFIPKPINLALLSHRVRYALRASAAAEASRRTTERLVRAQRVANLGNWSLSPDGGAEMSEELLRILEIPAGVEPAKRVALFLSRVHPEDRGRVGAASADLRRQDTPMQVQFRYRRRDGSLRTLHAVGSPVLDEEGNVAGYEGITQDITERVEAQERIRRLADYDATTGLPNRKLFLESAWPRLPAEGGGGALFHLDIDLFKAVNDAFGRATGDAILREIAGRLRAWVAEPAVAGAGNRAGERPLLACVGGDAFTLLLPHLREQDEATAVAQQLGQLVAAPMAVDGQSLVLTASIGVAFFPVDAPELPQLMTCAEQSVHAAKHSGRSQHRFFNPQMNALATRRLLLETELRRAIEQDELRLYFQPKVDATDGAIVGAEALVRWQHRERGLLGPAEFVPLAEESGLILPLTRWVLERACRHLRCWRDAGLPAMPLAVNLAAPSLVDDALVTHLDALMLQFDLAPGLLMLEMTETLLMRDVQAGVAMLEKLRARGYGLSLDDFGTGYSSLGYLKRFPVDELKIDRAFVTDITNGGRDSALAAAIIALGHELGLGVVAEGVETEAQSAFLLERGCNVQQGYLFGGPMAATELELLRRRGVARGMAAEAPIRSRSLSEGSLRLAIRRRRPMS